MITIPPDEQAKIDALENPKVIQIINFAIDLMQPKAIQILTDDPNNRKIVRDYALKYHEESTLAMEGHTLHYDGYNDQGRDREHTAVLLPAGQSLSRGLTFYERESSLKEVLDLMKGAMKGRTMIVRFYSLGPLHSTLSLLALQITDSYYVIHSEDMLYRPGYEEFKIMKNKDAFFYFLHAAGELDDHYCSKNVPGRRIYIDPLENRVLSVNNQYAGNSLACKKLALRLAINKANNEDWLAEHYFISAFSPLHKKRKTYFAGAYPSACGKTSTAMIPGAVILGDDIAYLKVGKRKEMRAVNIEQGIFGIIQDVNSKDDPVIYRALTTPKELIFSNVLSTPDGKVYWQGMGNEIKVPKQGINHSGQWAEGKLDTKGKPIPLSHGNARFTLRLQDLENVDPKLDAPEGVKISAILYGGRDSDTCVPVVESLNWDYGVFIGATIESESTTATLGAVGQRESNPMSNMDFIIVPLGKYLSNHIAFGKRLKDCPKVYGTNYFLKGPDGKYLNTKLDKKVWVLWAEGRIHQEYDALQTPIGFLPIYSDLKDLFAQLFNGRIYTEKEYEDQFSIRIDKYLEKYERMEQLFKNEPLMPPEFWQCLNTQRSELQQLKEKTRKTIVSPFYFTKKEI